MNKIGDYKTLNSSVADGPHSDPKVNEIHSAVSEAVKNYVPTPENQDENLEFAETEEAPLCEMFNRYSTTCDKILLWNGFFWSFIFGGSMPGFCIVFGALVDDLGAQQPGSGKENPMKTNTIYMIYVAGFAFLSSAMYISSFSIFSESVQYHLKIEYMKAALEKDAAFYDEQNPNEMAAKINKEAQAVRRGCSEKVGVVNFSIWMFLLGFAAAFTFGWKYSLILLGGLPAIVCVGIAFGMAMQSGTTGQMKAYSQSAGYAEQALQSIKIVHTYGNELLELKNYVKYLDRAKQQKFKS